MISPALSFVVPMYNAEKYIDRCIASILSQNLDVGSYEIILVNDGSCDDTAVLAARYAQEHRFIKVVHQANQGLSVARNAGFVNATGDYLWFVDVDDYLLSGSAKVLLDYARVRQLDVLTFQVKHVNPSPVDPTGFNAGAKIEPVMHGLEYVATHNYNNGAWLYLVKRSYLLGRGIQFEPGRYCEDGMFTLDLFSGAERIAHYPSAAYAYVRNPSGITKSKSPGHYNKVAADFFFAADFFDNFLKRQIAEKSVSAAFRSRVISRRDSYIFFLCIRLLRSTLSLRELANKRNEMKLRGWLPLRNLSREEYPGMRYTFMLWVLNCSPLFFSAASLLRMRGWFFSR